VDDPEEDKDLARTPRRSSAFAGGRTTVRWHATFLGPHAMARSVVDLPTFALLRRPCD